MAIDRRGWAPTYPLEPRRSGGRPATAFLPREECRKRSRPAGEESWRWPLRSRRPRRSRPPSRLANQRTHPETAGPNRVGRGMHGPTTPTPQRGRQPPAPAPPRTRPGPPSPAPVEPRQALLTRPAPGRQARSRLPAWTGRRTKDGTRERALLGQKVSPAFPRIRDGRVEAAQPDRTNMVASTTPRRLASRRSALTRARGEEASGARRSGIEEHETCPRAMGGLTTGRVPLYGA